MPQSSENPSIEADLLKPAPGSTLIAASRNGNGHQAEVASEGLVLPGETSASLEPADLLDALQAMRLGDFSVRLPTPFRRARGQDRRRLQRHRRGQRAHGPAARARRPGGRPRRQDPHPRPLGVGQRRLGRHGELGQHADRRSAVADHRGDPHDHGGGQGRPAADGAARRRRAPAEGRVPALRHHRQRDDQAALGVHLRGDARRARGRARTASSAARPRSAK